MNLAKRLNRGDTIGIITPSYPVTDDFVEQFESGINYLQEMGFKTKIAKNALLNTLGYSMTAKEKAEDINSMFADNSIKAIICSLGGHNSISALEYIKWDIIKNNPKIIMGISDITTLLNAIFVKTGLITYHGNDVMWGFGRTPTDYDKTEFFSRLVDVDSNYIKLNGETKTIRAGRGIGTLVGGNIHCLLKLAGTPFFPNIDNSILFLESGGITPEDCDAFFWQLRHIGIFEKIKGCIIGYIDGMDGKVKNEYLMENILKRITADYNFPILKVNNFGHNCPNTVLPIGAKIRLDTGKREIEIVDKYLC